MITILVHAPAKKGRVLTLEPEFLTPLVTFLQQPDFGKNQKNAGIRVDVVSAHKRMHCFPYICPSKSCDLGRPIRCSDELKTISSQCVNQIKRINFVFVFRLFSKSFRRLLLPTGSNPRAIPWTVFQNDHECTAEAVSSQDHRSLPMRCLQSVMRWSKGTPWCFVFSMPRLMEFWPQRSEQIHQTPSKDCEHTPAAFQIHFFQRWTIFRWSYSNLENESLKKGWLPCGFSFQVRFDSSESAFFGDEC